MSLPDSSFSLYLRQLYQEDNRLVVILEIEQRKGGCFSMVEEKLLNLSIDTTNCNHELPATYFVVQDIEMEQGQPIPWWLKNVNHVCSDKEIPLFDEKTCIYNGKLKVPNQFHPEHYEILEGQAIKRTISSPLETNAIKVSDISMFPSSTNNSSKNNSLETNDSYFQCTII